MLHFPPKVNHNVRHRLSWPRRTTAVCLIIMALYIPGCGIVPDERDPGRKHEVRVFESPAESVLSYMNKLNTHDAYLNFRLLRFKLRRAGRQSDGYTLAKTLPLYSERKHGYTNELEDMISDNRELLKSL